MTNATLTLEGMEQIKGTVEIGGDYARFRTDVTMDESEIVGPLEGELTIEGKPERVVLENCRTTEGKGCEITLRRITPEAR
jgi:hypothetical protein